MLKSIIIPKILITASYLFALVLVGCQSSTSQKTTINSKERPLHVTRSPDGLQNIRWKILEIDGQKAKFFQQDPYLELNANLKRVNGHTGCNPIFGKYQLNTHTGIIDIDVKAGHQSCDQALAQEASLMNALNEVKRYKIVGNRLQIMNTTGQIVLVMQK
ncbi:hypothetical protein A3K93_02085 [Acinetobacter sp. NCu2D-2]|uniref:META domain-containing protein n=1 Tax=Acinetobacter sp. NCu2D-2 TaxID=1608473 RepID=UPI0007CDA43E|nr:META domain-containing protein [Acinetobacter sp. NCu2D-2]ANF81103.1 hypothetical protein A3K93_02085 [Acinetobacter sp. NCu2D-2]